MRFLKQEQITTSQLNGDTILDGDRLVLPSEYTFDPEAQGKITVDGDMCVRHFQTIGDCIAVNNNTGVLLAAGSVVHIHGSVGDIPAVSLSIATDNDASQTTVGIVREDILDGEEGHVTIRGVYTGIDTSLYAVDEILYLSDSVSGGLQNTPPVRPNNTIPIAKVITSAVDGVVYIDVNLKSDRINNVIAASAAGDPTGWVDNSAVSISYDSANRQITITGDLRFMWRGQIIELESPWTSPQHSTTLDQSYFLLSTDGINWTWSTSPWAFSDMMIAYVYYGTSDKFSISETHGIMPWQAHEEFHQTQGTYRISGGILSNYTLDSTTAADRRFDISASGIKDEDNITAVPLLNDSIYTHFRLTGTGTGTFYTGQTEITNVSANTPYWNEWDGAAWVQTPMTVSYYSTLWVIAVPTTDDTGSQAYRYLIMQGQSEGLLINQQALFPSDLDLGNLENLFTEFVFITKIIIRYIGGNWQLTEVTNLTGTRNSVTASSGRGGGGGLSSVSSDATLTGDGSVIDPLKVASSPISAKVTLANRQVSDPHYVPFSISATSNQALYTDDVFVYNPGSNLLSVGNISTTGNVTIAGELRGPSNLIIDPATVGDNTGTVTIKGNLTIEGTTTTLNSTTLDVADINITVAKNATTPAEAAGAGITVAGANATMIYNDATDKFVFNKGITATLTGNADTATKLATTRNIAIDGDASGNANFDGSADITITLAVGDDTHNHTDSTISGTQASIPSTVVERNIDGDINARLFRSEYDITNATINYVMTQVDTVSNNAIFPSTIAQLATAMSGSTMSIAGNANTATKLATARTIELIGDATGSASFDGSGGIQIDTTVSIPGFSPGDYILSNSNDSATGVITFTNALGINTRLIGTTGAYNTGTEIGIAAGETAAQMDANISGETVWLGGEAGVKAISSPDNWATGWANRYEATLINATGNSIFPGNISAPSVTLGAGVTLSESIDRADLLQIRSSTSTWGGLQITNNATEVLASFIGEGNVFGLYDDLNDDWVLQTTENAGVGLYCNGIERFITTTTGIKVTGDIVPDQTNLRDIGVATTGVYDNIYANNFNGNATTATSALSADQLTTPRTISLGGDVTGSANFDGSANITITATVADNSHSHTGYLLNTTDTMTGTFTATSAVLVGSSGTGQIGLTVNDGYGNANLTFNHTSGIPDETGNAGRISVNVDSTTNASMKFGINTALVGGVASDVVDIISITPSGFEQLSGKFTSQDIEPDVTNIRNIGSASLKYANMYATTFQGEATSAQYADLAENYVADKNYPPGTVLMFGGEFDVTKATGANTHKVAGVVSTKPAHLMDSNLQGEFVVPLALQGKVPVAVIGKVEKGDLLVVSEIAGFAMVNNDPKVGTVIGKALEDKTNIDQALIMVVVGRD